MARPKSVSAVLVSADVVIDADEVDAVTALDVTAEVLGLRVGYPVVLWAASLTANLGICNVHASAKDTLKFRLVNPTAGAIDPGSLTFRVIQF